MKVDCVREKKRQGWQNPDCQHLEITRTLPFFSKPGCYVHRVRSGQVHTYKGDYTHTSFRFWCGGSGFLARTMPGKVPGWQRLKGGGSLVEAPPNGCHVCATCEGRAIGAGQLGSHMIAGILVKFAPHTANSTRGDS